MIDVFRLLAAYVLPGMIGFIVVTFLDKKEGALPLPEKLALSFALGSGLISFYLLYLAMAGVRFNWVSLAPFFTVAIFGGLVLVRRRGFKGILGAAPQRWFGSSLPRKKAVLLFLGLLLLGKIIWSGWMLATSPTYFDDSAANWNNKAKIFYYHRTVVLEEKHPDFLGGYLTWYPLGIPLFKTWVHLCMGRWAESAANLYTFCIFLCLGVIAYYNLVRFLRPLIALLFTYIMLSIPLVTFHAGFSYGDLIVAFYFFAGIVYLIRWVREADHTALALSALLFAVGIETKNEMTALFISAALPVLILQQVLTRSSFRNRVKTISLYLSLVLVLNLPWLVLKRIYHLATVLPASYRQWEFHPEAGRILISYFFSTGNYNILWVISFAAILFSLPWLFQSELKYILLAIAGAFTVTLTLFFVTSFFEFLRIGTTINRALLSILPLMVFYLAVFYGKLARERSTVPGNHDNTRS